MSDELDIARSDFPDGFLFGAATAAYQIEGSSFGGAGPCHWDSFAATPGNVVKAETGAVACDHYHHWEADLDLMASAGFDAYRFSTSWPRVLPEGRGAVNPEGLDFYDRLVDGILARGLKPSLTLYHWDMPSALALQGGWTNRDVAGWLADYAQVIFKRLGDRVGMFATINEPWCVAWLSHFIGAHAPGLRDIRAAAHAMHHVLLAHATTMQALKAAGAKDVGIVLNFETATPATDTPADISAAARGDAIYNRWFVEGIGHGTYPSEVLDGLAPHMPKGWEDDMERISQPLDWLGVNYYTRNLYSAAPDTAWPSFRTAPGTLPKTDMDWEIRPEGLTEFLVRLAGGPAKQVPIYVTENGMAGDDHVNGGAIDDPVRIGFIDGHLKAARDAIDQGVDLRGFFYWSLLDNYEWAYGYDKRFGILHVDYATQGPNTQGVLSCLEGRAYTMTNMHRRNTDVIPT